MSHRTKRRLHLDEAQLRTVAHLDAAMQQLVEDSTKLHLQKYASDSFSLVGYRAPEMVLRSEEVVSGVAVRGLDAATDCLTQWVAIQVAKGHAIELKVTKPRTDVIPSPDAEHL